MNIFRPQKPYVFRPPRYSPLFAAILRLLNKTFYLRRKYRIRHIEVEGAERIAELARARRPMLIAPNHADHADPHVMLSLAGKCGTRFRFMAAREGFERQWLHAFALQHGGAFSVDREGSDIAAFKMALRILSEGRNPLVIFPEGEIFHHHERLDPLNEGVATMLLRAAAKLPDGQEAYLVPTALRYLVDESVSETFSERMNALEERITWKPREEMDVVDRIYRLGAGLLAIKEVEFLGEARVGDLIERITGLRNRIVSMVEAKHLKKEHDGSVPERIKAIRNAIRKRLTDAEHAPSETETADLYDDLESLHVAFQMYSYPGQYLREEPSVHRIAETILKLEEDVLEVANYPSARDVHVRFGEPIEVGGFLADRSLTTKTGVGPLTAELSNRIQAMLDGDAVSRPGCQ